jgi:uncharacterized delta-60 repeat protein
MRRRSPSGRSGQGGRERHLLHQQERPLSRGFQGRTSSGLRRFSLWVSVIAALAWVQSSATSAGAVEQAGSLDTTFGGDGEVTTSFAGGFAIASGVAIQADGKIVAAGTVSRLLSAIVLARYQTDGSLDPTFGGDGRVRATFPGGMFVRAVAIQADGRIVVAGSSGSSVTTFAVARFTTDGSLDRAFGDDGRVTTAFRRRAEAFDVAIQADGKIITLGTSGRRQRFALVRYNTDGSLDVGFGGDGKVLTDVGDDDDTGNGIVIQADGRIVAAGTSGCDFAVARYNGDGSIDTTFGVGGKVTSNLGLLCQVALDVAIQADGRIVVAGFGECLSNECVFDFVLARYNADGTLDSSFANDGSAQAGFGRAVAGAIAIQDDGRIVAAGTNESDGEFALARYDPDGSPDTSFGENGTVMTRIGQLSGAFAVALQADGKIVAAGFSERRRMRFGLARYLAA